MPNARSILWVVAASLLGTLVSACGLGQGVQPRPQELSRARPDEVISPEERLSPGFLPWASDEPLLVVVDKPTRRLVLYRFGNPAKSYPVVLGRNPGRKLYEGDRRTPSGLYEISEKRPHPRYDRFMSLNYPNEIDRANYLAALSAGRIPATKVTHSPGAAGLGGEIGIHGSDKEELNRVGINWTYGCVSLTNRDVEELYAAVPRGTPVLIRDNELP